MQSPHKFDFEKGRKSFFQQPLRWNFFRHRPEIQNITKAAKVGHAGTLDPLASGLLIICTGRLNQNPLMKFKHRKRNIPEKTFQLGATTPSYDLEQEMTRLSIIPTSQMKISSIPPKLLSAT